jgi:hypothetical protein
VNSLQRILPDGDWKAPLIGWTFVGAALPDGVAVAVDGGWAVTVTVDGGVAVTVSGGAAVTVDVAAGGVDDEHATAAAANATPAAIPMNLAMSRSLSSTDLGKCPLRCRRGC